MLDIAMFKKPKNPVAVVVPMYKSELTAYEKVSLDRCLKELGAYPIIVIAPERLSPEIIQRLMLHEVAIEYFDNAYFENINGYSRLLLRSEFYARFIEYENILIYQLDAFVFTDRLVEWCRQSYDYIGAPWIGVDWFDNHHKPGFGNLWGHFRYQKQMVGNGGFSLRRVKSFLFALMVLKNRADNWTHNEDLFWSFEVPNNLPFFRKPDVDTALKFSFELNPKECFARTRGELPFGCHAWEKYDIEFWRPIFLELGYTI